MKQNETASSSVNLFPLFAISILTLLGVVAAVIMLFGLHSKIQKPAMTDAVIAANEIGQIELDKDLVRINLMTRTDTGGLEKSQQITVPLEAVYFRWLPAYDQLYGSVDRARDYQQEETRSSFRSTPR